MVFICFVQSSQLRVERLSSGQNAFPHWFDFDFKTLGTCFCQLHFQLLCVSLAFRSSQLAVKISFHPCTHMHTPTFTQTFSQALVQCNLSFGGKMSGLWWGWTMLTTTTTTHSEEVETPTQAVCLATLHCFADGLCVLIHCDFTDYKKYSICFIQTLKYGFI